MEKELKEWIDSASYIQLLDKWRHAPAGSPYFQGETGEYYEKVMAEKRETTDHVAASKAVGWGKD